MVHIEEMKKEEIANVLAWNIDTKDFLTQWSNLTYPLTKEQYEERIDSDNFIVYSVFDDTTMIGTIQFYHMDQEHKSTMVGCFLMNPAIRNKGYGEQAMKAVLHKAFADVPEGFGFQTVGLGVYAFNTGARKCYEKCGFVTTSELICPNGWRCYMMERKK